MAKLTNTGLHLCLVPGSPLFLHSVVASQWKPHHAISSPHWFLWPQDPNHRLTPPASLHLSLSIKLSLFWFQCFSSGLTAHRSGCPNPVQLSVSPNCSWQIGAERGHNEWFTGRCWLQDTSCFSPHVGPTNVFFLSFTVEFCYLFAMIFLICNMKCRAEVRKTSWKVWKKYPPTVTVNRCLDLCFKHSTNHLRHPSQWSAAPRVCNQPVSGCKFQPRALRISSGVVGVWMWRNLLSTSWSLCLCAHLGGEVLVSRRQLKGQSSANISLNNVLHVASLHLLTSVYFNTFYFYAAIKKRLIIFGSQFLFPVCNVLWHMSYFNIKHTFLSVRMECAIVLELVCTQKVRLSAAFTVADIKKERKWKSPNKRLYIQYLE